MNIRSAQQRCKSACEGPCFYMIAEVIHFTQEILPLHASALTIELSRTNTDEIELISYGYRL